jgi:sec-independent protein translocase protein TatA
VLGDDLWVGYRWFDCPRLECPRLDILGPNSESAMFGIGTTELLILMGIVIVIFGARRLPELGSGMVKAIKNFKAGVSGKDEIDVTPKPEKVGETKPES